MSDFYSEKLVSISDWIRFAYSQFRAAEVFCGHGYGDQWDESVGLVLQSLSLPWDFDQSLWSSRLTDSEAKLIAQRIERRVVDRVPLAYLTGEAWFCELPFKVDERVLVPRSPIAELIQSGFEPWLAQEPQRVLDLCTGSGCIGIACAYEFLDANVVLSDVSEDAIAVAEQNVTRHDLNDRVQIVRSDVFSEMDDAEHLKFDLIVSNPPYVDAEDIASMPQEYHAEPALGLGSGDDGLDITRQILKNAARFLNPGGLLVIEVGNSWVALEQAYADFPFTWVDFERGGHGVCVISYDELNNYCW